MSTRKAKAERDTLLQGTLDLLILRTLAGGAEHGHGIVRSIQASSEDALLVDHGSLYPALQRLEARGWISARWGVSVNNRRARFYELTGKGRRRLASEAERWRRMVEAVTRVLGPDYAEG
jgi:PadR family transcriptional regulator, regulatory protein PadR